MHYTEGRLDVTQARLEEKLRTTAGLFVRKHQRIRWISCYITVSSRLSASEGTCLGVDTNGSLNICA
jgi:hypothetical protein